MPLSDRPVRSRELHVQAPFGANLIPEAHLLNGTDQFRIAHALVRIEIEAEGSWRKKWVLGDNVDARADGASRDLGEVPAVYFDPSGLKIKHLEHRHDK